MSGPSTGQNFTIYAGDTATIYIPITDSDGNPVDLTGAQRARWWLGKAAKSVGADVYLKKDSLNAIRCDDGVVRNEVQILPFETDKWQLVVHINGADTETGGATLIPKPAIYYHEAEIVDANGVIATVALGSATIGATIVRNL